MILNFRFVLALLFSAVHVPIAWSQLPTAKPTSIWYGEMDAGVRVFRFVITAQLNANGLWDAELNSLDEGETKFKLAKVVMDGKSLQFELTQTKATYSGSIDSPAPDSQDSKPIAKGKWHQNGADIELNFKQFETAPQDKPTEVWVGDMKAGLQTLKMQFRVYESGAVEKVYADSVSQKVGGFKATRKVDGDSVEFDVASLRGKFKGKKVDDKTLAGKWSQGVALDLKLEKVDKPVKPQTIEHKRPQTPKPPFPYDSEIVQFDSLAAGVRLEGTLTIPKSSEGSKHFPAVVLVTGSGPQDRDETLLGHKPFFVLADYLTRRGIAVLRYDDRGVGQSSGDFSTATSEDFAKDASGAIDFLKQHARIDSKHIGIIGHSEGGLVAPLVAAQKPEVAWIVLMAGTGVNGEEILYSQGKLIVEAEGGDADVIARQRILQETVFAAIKGVKPNDGIDALVEPTSKKIIERVQQLEADTNKKPAEPIEQNLKELIALQVRANLMTMNSPWFRFFTSHEPAPVLEQVRCPVLALNGTKDLQVDPKLNLPKIESSLRAGGNKEFKIVELPGLNHLFQTSDTGAVSQYESIEETIAPVALQTMGDWILEHVK